MAEVSGYVAVSSLGLAFQVDLPPIQVHKNLLGADERASQRASTPPRNPSAGTRLGEEAEATDVKALSHICTVGF